jgi:hypothetical protein
MSAVLQMDNFRVTTVTDFAPEYEGQVLELARMMHAESSTHSSMPLDEKKLLEQLRASATNPYVYFRLAVRGSEVMGGFFGLITPVFFSSELAARDLAWFVKPSRRGGYAAVLLVADWERWGKEKGVKKFMLGQSTGVDIETTRALYERLGYRVVGFNTVKEY